VDRFRRRQLDDMNRNRVHCPQLVARLIYAIHQAPKHEALVGLLWSCRPLGSVAVMPRCCLLFLWN